MSVHARRSIPPRRWLRVLVVAALIVTSLGVPAAVFAAVDVTPPTIEAPIIRFRVDPPGQFASPGDGDNTAPIMITLDGSDSESAFHYSIQKREMGHGYRTIGRDVDQSRQAYRSTITKGHSYRFRIKAIDDAGNSSAWKETPTIHLSAVGDGDSRIRYSKAWKHVHDNDATSDSLMSTTTAGSIARLTFRGRAVAWVAALGPTRGSAKVYIDGKLISTVDLHAIPLSSDPDHADPTDRMVMFTKTFSKVGTHEIVLRALGTAGHPRVDVDNFLIID